MKAPIELVMFGFRLLGRRPAPPTPLEVATAAFTRAQFALLEAKTHAEDANAEVALYTGRLDRLSRDIDTLKGA